MSPRRPVQPGRAGEPANDPPQAARLRWFLAAHLLAVLLIYAIAMQVGGGMAAAPFPPDLPGQAARPHESADVPRATAIAPTLAVARHVPVLPNAAPDPAPPWAPDAAGRPE